MSYSDWLNLIRSAEKTSLINGTIRKVFYKFPDGRQMVEEYNMETGLIKKRSWKKCRQLMGEPEWEDEIGETINQINKEGGDSKNSLEYLQVKQSNTEPILTKRIAKKNIEWRIRNLPYSIDVYQVTADPAKRSIVVRTTNKKYYKIIPFPELDRCNLLPSQNNISIHHQFNTLIITYKKPEILCEMEAAVLLELKNVETETGMEDLLQELLKK